MPRTKAFYFAVTLALSSLCANAQNITTIAGGGPNNLPATAVSLQEVNGVAVDSSGNFYIASGQLNRVFKVNGSGLLTVVAGTGQSGFGGDGAAAALAYLDNPNGVAVDASGDVFISDSGNCRIREVNTSGIINTIAGSATCGYNGDGIAATSAQLFNPTSVAVDSSGDVFIADTYNHRIREVDTSGNIHTIAGTGQYGYAGDGGYATSALLNSPYGVAVDHSGNVLLADTNNCRIREVTGGIINTVAGNYYCFYGGDGGPATSASLLYPKGVAVDTSGDIFISDTGNQRIREVKGGTINSIAGNGGSGFYGDGSSATGSVVSSPQSVAVNAIGDVFIADTDNQRVREINTGGIINTVAGNGSSSMCLAVNGYAATDEPFCSPQGISFDTSGDLFVADAGGNVVSEVSSGGILTVVAGDGVAGFNGDGTAISQNLSYPTKAVPDNLGNFYIADSGSNRIREVNSSGMMTTVAGTGTAGFNGYNGTATSQELSDPTGIAFDGNGNYFIADYGNNLIRKVDGNGNMTTVAGTGTAGYTGDNGLATSATLTSPRDIAVDSSDNIYIADTGNNVIRKVDTHGNITTVAGTGTCSLSSDGVAIESALCAPSSVSLVVAGTLAISDTGNARVRYLYGDGTIQTVAGDGTNGFSGDGGAATSANLSQPFGIAADGSGDLWIADTGNLRIRKVTGLPVSDDTADLAVTMMPLSSSVLPGANITYSISLTNNGPNSAGSVVVSDNLPASLTLVSCMTTGGGVCGGSGNNVTVSFGSLSPGGSATITLVATVSASVAPGTSVINTAAGTTSAYDPNLSNNSSTTTVTVQQTQTISFAALPNQVYSTAPFTVSASASSGLTVNFNSQTTSVCSVSGTTGNMVTLLLLGTCTIQATQTGNTAYMAAQPVNQSFQVTAGGSGTSLSASPNPAVFGSQVTLSASVTPAFATGTVTFYNGANVLGVASVSSGVATLNTTLLPSVVDSLKARYVGAGTDPFMSSLSSAWTQNVNAQAADGFTAASGSPFAVGSEPFSVVVGDFNADGAQDLAVANFLDNTVTVLIGNGSGAFTPASGSPISVGANPISLAVADFNGDGKADLAVVNEADNTITVLLGNGNGTFSAASGSPFATGHTPKSVGVADFNNDGIADLAIANTYDGTVTVLLGNGSGGFTHATGSPFAAGYLPTSLAVGDFNGDGNADLAIANQHDGEARVLLGNGSGGFTAATGSPFAVGSDPNFITVGDFNGDGKPDLAVANEGDNTVSVLLNNGTGGFSSASNFTVGTGPVSVAVADINGDRKADLVVTTPGHANNLTILLGNGSGSFSAAPGSPFTAGWNAQSVAVGEFNGDGKTDLAVPDYSNGSVTVLLATDVPRQLQDSQQPSTGTAGVPLGNLVVQVLDARGNLMSASMAAVTISSTPAGVNGTLTVNAVSGVATFSNLVFYVPGTYKLTASATGLTSATTANVVVSASPSGTPGVVSATPNAANGLSNTFALTYSDTGGNASLKHVAVIFNPLVSVAGSCYVSYSPAANLLFLENDGGTGTTSITPGAGMLSNSQCTVSGSGTSVQRSGNNVTLNLAVTASSTYTGQQTMYLYAEDNNSAITGWVNEGTWTPAPNQPPTTVSVTPPSANGLSNTFVLTYSDPNGATDLSTVRVDFSPVVSTANSCYVLYNASTNRLYLYDNAGTGSTKIALGSGTLYNSQCSISGSGSSVQKSGDNLVLTLAVTASSTYTGKQNIYMYASDNSAANSGWVSEGKWSPGTNQAPTIVSATPTPATGLSNTFVLTYSDPNGATDLNTVKVIFGNGAGESSTCYVWYVRGMNLLYLENDAGTGTTSITPGSGTLSNSQCSISGSGSSVQTSGDNLVLNLAVTAAGTYTGAKNISLYATDNSGLVTGWVREGTWTP